MALEKIADKFVDTDVLVVGGGIAGCPAAVKAAESGLNVTLIEKAKTDRSGHSGVGLDHFGISPIENFSMKEQLKSSERRFGRIIGEGRYTNPNIEYKLGINSRWALEEMERIGIPMRWDDGKYYWLRPGFLRMNWLNAKPLLAAAVRKAGVNVLERTMLVDLLTNNGKVVGATAANTRTGEFIVIKAKAVIIGTGHFARCYNPEEPQTHKYKFRYHGAPGAVSGDGYAAAYRAGAEMVGMDMGGLLWHRMRDDTSLPFGEIDHGEGIRARWLTWTGEDIIAMPTTREYDELERKGLDPLYFTLEHLPDDFHKRIELSIAEERLISLKMAGDRGFNPGTHRYELITNRPLNFAVLSGVNTDEYFKATVKGLYIIGDTCAGLVGAGNAASSGMLTGDSIHKYVSEAGEPAIDEGQVESQKQVAMAPTSVKDGTDPIELECSIRYICERYVGRLKSEGKLREGLRRLNTLRRVFLPKLMAKNPHYLMRCLEVRNIMDMAELHIQACLERKETRGNYVRFDYPEKDKSRDNKVTFQRLEKGRPLLELREMPDLKPEYAKEAK
jgi:succinate dehydrogenase/fumarate reductase flavoprotein subunit